MQTHDKAQRLVLKVEKAIVRLKLLTSGDFEVRNFENCWNFLYDDDKVTLEVLFLDVHEIVFGIDHLDQMFALSIHMLIEYTW